MKIALINPPWYFMRGQVAPTFSLGIACIAAVLREKGHDVILIDADAEGIGWGELRKRLEDFRPYVLGITATTSTYMSGLKAAKLGKEIGCFTVMGGPHASAIPEQTLNEGRYLDAVCSGEGEYTMLKMIECLEGEKALESVEGLSFRKGRKIIHNHPRMPIKNLDEMPFPARDMLPMNQTSRTLWGHPAGHIFSARGCPNKCTFCASHTVFGSTIRFRSPRNVLKEIEEMVEKFGIKQLAFSDDTFTALPKRVYDICNGIIESGWDLKWVCQARVNTVDYRLLRKMRDAGCVQIDYGVESGDPDVLREMKKNITHEQVKRAVRMTRSLGIKAFAYYIIGTPYDNLETIKRTIRFARRLGSDRSYFNILVPYPGTEIYNRAKYEKKLLIKDWSNFHQEKSVIKTRVPGWYIYKSFRRARVELYLTELLRGMGRLQLSEVLIDIKRGMRFLMRKTGLE